ncbi:MAG: undecaprenyldiphospho-muramoylpentapeptide beta-N-acetylglucosaminyltransferase [Sandaracinaceae bacterium]
MALRRVMVAGGGTGGHLFPGLAVVQELRRRQPGLEVTFVGTSRGIESRVLPGRGETLDLIDVTPLHGRTPGELLHSLGRLPGAARQALALLRRRRPDLVLGVGGYASGPVLLAAASRGVPTALLEQNALVGLTNRLLAPLAGRAYVAFESAADQVGRGRARLLGNPVRQDFVQAARAALADPEGFEARASTVLVLGGSQGAKALNETLPMALAALELPARGLSVLHQTGVAMRSEVEAGYREHGVPARVVPFVEDMARAYRDAVLVVARAGATTLAELCAIGRAAVLVPYPFAADDHQARNAEALAADGAAVAIPQRHLTAGRLTSAVRGLLDEPGRRRAMAEAARRHGRPDAAAAIVDDLHAWIGPELGAGEPGRQRPARRPVPGRAARACPPVHLEVLGPALLEA